MKTYNLNFIFFTVFILIFSIFSTNVFAVGVGHGDTTINFQPNLNVDIPFFLRNIKSGTTIELSAIGDLKDYVTFSEISPNGKFNATLHLPDSIEKPGTHTILIRAEEVPNATAGGISTVTAVQVPILIKVPYPGKYVEVSLDVPDAKVGEPVIFVISITNLGEQNVIAKGTIEIYNPDDEKIAAVYTEEKTVETTKSEELHAQWETVNVKEGEYKAIATITYDGGAIRTEKIFRIGTLLIKIIDCTKEFQKGVVNPFNIEIESAWNDKILDVYAEILIIDASKTQLASLKTPNTDIDPWGRKTITAYWDTTSINAETYDAEITLNYDGKTTEKIIKVKVVEKIEKQPVGKVVEEAAPLSTAIYTIIVICVIILAFYWFLKKRKG